MRIKQAINELITAFPRYSLRTLSNNILLGVFFYLQSKSNGIAILEVSLLGLKNYFILADYYF